MAGWTFYTCGSCRKRITTESEDTFYAIGVPYLKCERCGTVNDRSSRRNEWDLMRWPMRAAIVATVVFFGVIIDAGGAALVLVALDTGFGILHRSAGTPWPVPSLIGS